LRKETQRGQRRRAQDRELPFGENAL